MEKYETNGDRTLFCWDFPSKKDIASSLRNELDRLIERNPELAGFQEEIERRLNRAGNDSNRMEVLVFMMEASLSELHNQISSLLFLL